MGIVDLQKSAATALGFVVRRYTVGLSPRPAICDKLASTPDKIKIASGVLVRRREKIYVVTADHFLKVFRPEEVEVLFAPNAGDDGCVTGDASCTKLKEEMKIADPAKMSMAVPLRVIDCIREQVPDSDLAAIEIPKDLVPTHCSILEYGSANIDACTSGGNYCIGGLPSKSTYRTADHVAKAQNFRSGWSLEGAELAKDPSPKDWGDDPIFDPPLHHALRPVEKIQHLSPDEAYGWFSGYSGGGLWLIPPLTLKGPNLWSPTGVKLCGIQSGYHKGLGLLKVTRASIVASVLGK